MSFKKLQIPQYPPRLWVLVGFPGSGKSTFSTQMRYPLLPVDADHRFEEVAHLASGDIYELSDNPADAVDPEAVYKILNQNMPGSKVGTIIVDSLTTIITPLVVQAVMDNDAGRNRNRMAAFKDKALAMRMLQDAITKWGTDVLWIYHLQEGRDDQARQVIRATLSATERARLYRSINLELHIEESPDKKRRGIKVVWARRGRAGMVIWDDTGKWAGMPEKIEKAVYGGLSVEEQQKIEQEAGAVFPTEEAAIEWGRSQGAFKEFHHAKNAFGKLKKANPGLSLAELSAFWVEDIEERLAAKAAQEVKAEQEQPAGDPPTDQALEDEFLFGRFCDHVTSKIKFFELADDPQREIADTLFTLGVSYGPENEAHLLDVLNVHVQTLPSFKTPKEFITQVKEDFGFKDEAAAREMLAALGITGFPRSENGELEVKTRRLYWRVKLAVTGHPNEEIPFD